MIVDCYTCFWESPQQVGINVNRGTPAATRSVCTPRNRLESAMQADAGAQRHFEAAEPVDKAIVVGFDSAYLNAQVSNDQIAAYVRTHPEKLIGFAGIDPSSPNAAIDSMRYALQELGMMGVSVAPPAQDFHPSASPALKVYEAATAAQVPVLFHSGPYLAARAKMEYARPILLDEVAREFPSLKIIIAHLGFPWVDETLVLLAKHACVYADVSWLLNQPWQAYQALLAAHQYGVMDKLLFGSGFPFTSAAACIEGLYSVNQLVHGTNLPKIPRDQLRGIVERDALDLLGITGKRTQTVAD